MSIQRVISAALELEAGLEEVGLPFRFIGGIAVQRWGEPRLTVDADATVLTGWSQDESLVDALLARSPRDVPMPERLLSIRHSLPHDSMRRKF